MNLKGFLLIFSATTIALLSSCTQDDIIEKDPTLSENYLPLNIGDTLIYEVDSVYFSIEGGNSIRKDSTQQLIREIISDSSIAEDDRLLYIINRDFRQSTESSWKSADNVLAWEEGNEIVRQEGNLPYVKMLKDVNEGTSWNPHKYFDAESIEVFIKSNPVKPYTVPYEATITDLDTREYAGESIDSVITVELIDFDDNFIAKRYSIERYAKNIGLVEKIEWIVDTQCRIRGGNPADCEDLSWPEKAEAGYYMHQKIKEWK